MDDSNLSAPRPSPAPATSMIMVATKASSVPKMVPVTLKPQISAPSNLFSLKENPAPPFKRPGTPYRPTVVLGTIMKDEHVIAMVAASESDPKNGMKDYLTKFLVDKKITERYNISEKKFLVSFLLEAIDYAAQHDFNATKLSCMLTIYLTVHLYFKWYYWTPPSAVWAFFKELMIRHTIEDSPAGQEVYEPEECYDIMTHFHTNYLNNLPLIHIITFQVHKLKLDSPGGQDVFEPEEAYDILTHFHTNYLSHLPLIHLLTFRAHRLKFVWPFKK